MAEAGRARLKNWREKLFAFMQGRYGVDELYYGLFGAWIVLYLAGVCTRFAVLRAAALLCLIFMMFRMLSRNTARRRRENAAFLRIWNPVKGFFTLTWARLRDCRTHVYRRCPACGATLRLPHKRGTHTAVCPRCAGRFEVHIVL